VPVVSNSVQSYITFMYNSYRFTWDDKYWASPDAFWNALSNQSLLTRPAGFCSAQLTDLSWVQNQALCNGGKENLTYQYTLTIYEPTGADWMFRMGVDWGKGGMMQLDGEYLYHIFPDPKVDLWWGGSDWSNPLVITLPVKFVKPGLHQVEFRAAEMCCDGRTAIQFKRSANGQWTDMTTTSIDTVARSCEPTPQCTAATVMDCTSAPLSVVLQGNVSTFNPTTFTANLVAQLGLPSPSFITIVDVASTNAATANKFGLQAGSAVEVWFVIKGVNNETLTNLVERIQEKVLMPDGEEPPASILTGVNFLDDTSSGDSTPVAPPKTIRETYIVIEESTAGVKAGLIIASILAIVLVLAVMSVIVMWRRSRVVVTASNPGMYLTPKDVEQTTYAPQDDTDESSRHGNY